LQQAAGIAQAGFAGIDSRCSGKPLRARFLSEAAGFHTLHRVAGV